MALLIRLVSMGKSQGSAFQRLAFREILRANRSPHKVGFALWGGREALQDDRPLRALVTTT